MELTGKIKLIMETVTYASGFQKREMVVTTGDEYPQDIKVEFIKDKCSVLDGYSVGDSVTVGINIRGNEYEGKYYVNIQGWKIDNLSRQPAGGIEQNFQEEAIQGMVNALDPEQHAGANFDDENDLPF